MTVAHTDVLVIGLGNPILSDDGIGWRVVAALREMFAVDTALNESDIDVCEVAVGGLALAEMLVDRQRAIIVDAIMTQGGIPGTVYEFSLADLPGTLNIASAHDTNLSTALRALRRFGASVPSDDAIKIVAVEAKDVWTFSEECSPMVERALPDAVRCVRKLTGK